MSELVDKKYLSEQFSGYSEVVKEQLNKKVDIEQGVENKDKILAVGADGNLTLTEMPSHSSDVAEMVADIAENTTAIEELNTKVTDLKTSVENVYTKDETYSREEVDDAVSNAQLGGSEAGLVVTCEYTVDDSENFVISNVSETFETVHTVIEEGQDVILKAFPIGTIENPYILHAIMSSSMGIAFSVMIGDEGQISALSIMILSDNSVQASRQEYNLNGDAKTVNGHTVESNVPTDAKFTDTVYDDTEIKKSIEDKVNKEENKGLSTNDYTTLEKTKLAGIAEGANKTTVDSALSSTSTNPLQNKAIKEAIRKTSGNFVICNTAADEDTKEISMPAYDRFTDGHIYIYFTEGNSVTGYDVRIFLSDCTDYSSWADYVNYDMPAFPGGTIVELYYYSYYEYWIVANIKTPTNDFTIFRGNLYIPITGSKDNGYATFSIPDSFIRDTDNFKGVFDGSHAYQLFDSYWQRKFIIVHIYGAIGGYPFFVETAVPFYSSDAGYAMYSGGSSGIKYDYDGGTQINLSIYNTTAELYLFLSESNELKIYSTQNYLSIFEITIQ